VVWWSGGVGGARFETATPSHHHSTTPPHGGYTLTFTAVAVPAAELFAAANRLTRLAE